MASTFSASAFTNEANPTNAKEMTPRDNRNGRLEHALRSENAGDNFRTVVTGWMKDISLGKSGKKEGTATPSEDTTSKLCNSFHEKLAVHTGYQLVSNFNQLYRLDVLRTQMKVFISLQQPLIFKVQCNRSHLNMASAPARTENDLIPNCLSPTTSGTSFMTAITNPKTAKKVVRARPSGNAFMAWMRPLNA